MSNQPGRKTPDSGLLHPRNPHRGRYDLPLLCRTLPELSAYLKPSPAGGDTLDFSDNQAVLCLNRALLAHYYHVSHWQIPAGYLCPPIPGRADYIHYLADLLADSHQGQYPTGKKVKVLDIGTGANCIYPIIGSQSYGWQFVATDIDPVSVKSAGVILQSTPALGKSITLKQQHNSNAIFKGIITAKDRFALTLCNPPFHASMAEAKAGNQRKWQNLNRKKTGKGKPQKPQAALNFGGQKAELWCPGGEISFLKRMAKESVEFSRQVCWFTSLVSKGDNVRPLKKLLQKLGVSQCRVITMRQGQKVSRLIAWSFLSPEDQESWAGE